MTTSQFRRAKLVPFDAGGPADLVARIAGSGNRFKQVEDDEY